MTFKVAILIPSTTKERGWKNIKETYLYKINLKSFLLTYCPEHTYTYYVGIDDDDRIYSVEKEQQDLMRFISVMKNVSLQFISMKGIKKGHLTAMWNRLFHKAYHDGNDYFYQCGDDIQFINKGWVSQSIELLQLFNGYGTTGPHDKMQYRVHTQSFVSRRHYELFGFYFPSQITNWFCDDWITKTYWEALLFPLLDKWCMNVGGAPRYVSPRESQTYDEEKTLCDKLIVEGRKRVNFTIKNMKFPLHIMQAKQKQMKLGYDENEKQYGKMVNDTYQAILSEIKIKNNKIDERIKKEQQGQQLQALIKKFEQEVKTKKTLMHNLVHH